MDWLSVLGGVIGKLSPDLESEHAVGHYRYDEEKHRNGKSGEYSEGFVNEVCLFGCGDREGREHFDYKKTNSGEYYPEDYDY